MDLHLAGTRLSATLMARAQATEEALQLAQAHPALAVGCHIVLVDGDPVLPPHAIPSLIDPTSGCFYPTLGQFFARLLTGRIRCEEMEAEAAAQIASLQVRGMALTHLDTHKHVHLFPTVLQAILQAGRAAGINRIRNPFEPLWSIRATMHSPLLRRLQIQLLRSYEPSFRRMVAESGLRTTDGVIGVLATGLLDEPQLHAWMQAMPEGLWELVLHPGFCDQDLRQAHTRLLESRQREYEALLRFLTPNGIERISFAEI